MLASSSAYRKQQLEKLGLEFGVVVPAVDETPLYAERPVDLASRLAEEKCRVVYEQSSDCVVIGSDQVCAFEGRVFGKPGSFERATEQLQMFSGSCIEFFTSLCVMTPQNELYRHTDVTTVVFRKLTKKEIVAYLNKDQPFDCAGSFKVEALGLSLFDAVKSDDPSALMGLPLIKLCQFLRQAGLPLP